MKRKLLPVAALLIIMIGAFVAYEYVTAPKIAEVIVTKAVSNDGKPEASTNVFTVGDTIYVAAKSNRFWVNEADIVWYKGDIKTKNRFAEHMSVEKNKAGYYVAELVAPEALQPGEYGVALFVAGKNIIETKVQFTVQQ